MDSLPLLQRVGLNEKEAKVYLALLELGQATGYAIARKTELKRPTTYVALANLADQGLISKTPYGKKTLYSPEPPDKLMASANKTVEMLKSGIPDLLALYNTKKEKPRVQLFEGKEGLKHIYQKIYEQPKVYFFGSVREIFSLYPDISKELIQNTRSKKIIVQDILTDSPIDNQFIDKVRNESNYIIKRLKKGVNINGDFALIGDAAVFFSFNPFVFALVISSNDIVQLLKQMYDLAWESAENL